MNNDIEQERIEDVFSGIDNGQYEVTLQSLKDSPTLGPTTTQVAGSASPNLSSSRLVRAWEAPEPPPMEFFIEGLIPEGFCTILYGDGGMGKSYLAAQMAMTIVLGGSYGGKATKKSNVVYIDAELNADEFVRRAYRLARGMGLDTPPKGLYYYRLEGPLSDVEVRKDLEAAMAQSGAKFFILDSITLSTYTADASAASDVITIMKYLESLGTGLCLDHVSKQHPGASQTFTRAFGSVFKGNTARSTLHMVKADGGGLSLAQKKTNFSALQTPLNLKMLFGEKDVQVEFVAANDPSMEGISQHVTAAEQVYLALLNIDANGGNAEDIVAQLTAMGIDMAQKTVSNHLTVLRKAGRVTHHPLDKKKWIAQHTFTPHIDQELEDTDFEVLFSDN